MRLALDYLFEVGKAAVTLLSLADQGLAALGALDFDLRAVLHEVQLYLLLGHLPGDASDRALFRAGVNLVARTVKFEVLNQVSILVQLATRLLRLFGCCGFLGSWFILANPLRFR